MPDRCDEHSLLQQIRAQRTEPSRDLTARLFAAEQRHWDARTEAAAQPRMRRHLLRAAAALLLLAPLSWWLLHEDAPVAPVAPPAVLLNLPDGSPTYVSQAIVAAQMQRLVRSLAAALPSRLADAGTDVEEIAGVAHALAASGQAGNGSAHGPDLRLASAWLQQQLPDLHGGKLAAVLASLSMVAAETGDPVEAVRSHGQRLVDETLAQLRRGDRTAGLLSPETQASALADCGRLLALAPAFGIDHEQAGRLRREIAQELDERCRKTDAPELRAARLYGFCDLLEREPAEQTLRTWRPLAITARELSIMQHLAASLEPGSRGWTRFRLDLRQLATCALPTTAAAQADLLLCLANCSLGERTRRFSQAVAFAQRL